MDVGTLHRYLYFVICSTGSVTENAWIALTRPAQNCNDTDLHCLRTGWSWADGTQYQYLDWHNWFVSEPKWIERCARLKPSGEWWEEICYAQYNYICERGNN